MLWAPPEVKSVFSPFPSPPGWSTKITRQMQAGPGHILPALSGPCGWSLVSPASQSPHHPPTLHPQLSEMEVHWGSPPPLSQTFTFTPAQAPHLQDLGEIGSTAGKKKELRCPLRSCNVSEPCYFLSRCWLWYSP